MPADPEARRAFLEQRLQNLPPERRDAMLERLRAGGRGPFASAAAAPDAAGQRARRPQGGPTPRDAARDDSSLAASGAATIDALFAPLPRTESAGRVWVFAGGQLRAVRLRLGISDGQQTELIAGEVEEGTEVVTNVTIAGQATRPAASGFPFGQPGRGGFPGGGFPGGAFPGGGGGGRNGGNRSR